MKITMIKCDECGTLHENMEQKKFADRDWLAWGDRYHFCKGCAKQVTLFQIVQRFALQSEGKE